MKHIDDDNRVEQVTEPHRLLALLKNLQSKRTLLSARIDDQSRYYTTTLLKIDPQSQLIYLDELVPRTGHERLQSGCVLHVVGLLSGVPTYFTTPVISVDEQEGIAFYRVALPEQIDYQQKREFFRVRIGPKLNLGVRLTRTEGAVMLSGRLLDISLGGFGALLPDNSQLKELDFVTVNALDLPEKKIISCTAQICHIQRPQLRNTNGLQIGANFNELSSKAEQTLFQAILLLERAQIRKQLKT